MYHSGRKCKDLWDGNMSSQMDLTFTVRVIQRSQSPPYNCRRDISRMLYAYRAFETTPYSVGGHTRVARRQHWTGGFVSSCILLPSPHTDAHSRRTLGSRPGLSFPRVFMYACRATTDIRSVCLNIGDGYRTGIGC